jgi:hypothetical protein
MLMSYPIVHGGFQPNTTLTNTRIPVNTHFTFPFFLLMPTLLVVLPTDPRTLCPYCDSPLPSSPTPTFTGLLTRSFKHKSSHLDPRPTNPLGRRAPLAVFITVCQRHRFENEVLPEAEKRGWPKSIEWGGVRGRVERMKGFLQALIRNRYEDDEDDNGKRKSPRSMSIFWQEIIREVENKGSRAVAGVQGQFASFEKTQPG